MGKFRIQNYVWSIVTYTKFYSVITPGLQSLDAKFMDLSLNLYGSIFIYYTTEREYKF